MSRSCRPCRPVRSPARAIGLCALAALLLAGCAGRKVDEESFTRAVSAVASDANEGALVARTVVEHKTLRTTTRVRAEELSEDLTKQSAKFSTAVPNDHRVAQRAQQLGDIATKVQQLLDQLYQRPTDVTLARSLEASLAALGQQASKLEFQQS